MNSDTPVVFVVDDDPAVRAALGRLFKSVGLRAETFASAGEFLGAYRPETAGCLVLDVCLPGLGGLDLQQELAAAGARIPIVFITGHGDIPMTVRALKAGAVDFLPKPFDDKSLLDAVEQAITRDGDGRRDRAEADEARRRAASLTPREREVLALVVTGLLNKQIGGRLGVCEKTVKVHRGRVMAKMQADSVAELVRLAEKAGPTPTT